MLVRDEVPAVRVGVTTARVLRLQMLKLRENVKTFHWRTRHLCNTLKAMLKKKNKAFKFLPTFESEEQRITNEKF